MSRKKRKNKKRKNSDSEESDHLPYICKCQMCRKSFLEKTDLKDNKKFSTPTWNSKKENGNETMRKTRSCISLHEKETQLNKCDEHIKEIVQNYNKGLKKKKVCSIPAVQDKSDTVVKIILLDSVDMSSPETHENQHHSNELIHFSREITAQVKSDYVNLNVEITKGLTSKNTAQIVITNTKSLKKSRSYHDQEHQKCQNNANHKGDFVEGSCWNNEEMKNSSIKLEIIGEGIEVKYKTIKINADDVRIESDNSSGSCSTDNTDYLSNKDSCSSYPVSDYSLHERKHVCAVCRCSECNIAVPPPEEFADDRKEFANPVTEEETLLLEDLVGESSSIPSVSTCGLELEAEQAKIKADSYVDEKCMELHDSLHLPYPTDYTQCSSESYVPNKISQENAKSKYPIDLKVVRRRTFPEMYNESPRSSNYASNSDFESEHQKPTSKPLPDFFSMSVTEGRQKYCPPTELGRSLTSVSYLNCAYNSKDLNTCNATTDHENIFSCSGEDGIDEIYFINNCVDLHNPYEDKEDKDACFLYSLQKLDIDYDDNDNDKQINDDEDIEDLIKHTEEHVELNESGFDEEMLDSDNHDIQENLEIQNKCLLIQVTPPSRSSSREYILDKCSSNCIPTEVAKHPYSQPNDSAQSFVKETEILTRKRRGSVVTVVTGDLEQRLIIQSENQAVSDGITLKVPREFQKESKQFSILHRDSALAPLSDVEETDLENKLHSSFEDQSTFALKDISSQTSETFDPFLTIETPCHLPRDTHIKEIPENMRLPSEESNDIFNTFQSDDKSPRNSSDSAIPGTSLESMAHEVPCLIKSDSEENYPRTAEKSGESLLKTETPKKKTSKTDTRLEMTNKHLKLPKDCAVKDSRGCESPQEEASDRWAKKRKQFKETRNCSSAGGSSITSNITEESVNSEDTRSVDLGIRSENKDKGLYTESFHSASWIFRGDACSPDNSPRCLSKRPRSVAIRERTVRIAKGTGDYPWGFRIQFSKPILVTEVDTNGAAEEAGLQVGDIVMAVNGTDVTSIPHSEAATLARQGPDLLTLVVGSDISRVPNTPRPTCRGYLHKRTHSGLLKGWRKRWFVLKHDGSLQYYKHKKDEGKCRPLELTKLEGSEIGVDTSLGKPFVFRCVPQSGNRIFYFCATSNQEMKRWLEAMDKAVHPLNQNHVWVDVTMHNLNLPPLAIKNPECLGLLHQLDRNKDVWIQHYCILKDGCLYFYSSIRSTNALGGIYLQGYTVSEQSVNSRRCIIELRPPSEEFKTFYLSAGNATENKRWITALKISISKWLPLHQAIQDFMSRPPEETRM